MLLWNSFWRVIEDMKRVIVLILLSLIAISIILADGPGAYMRLNDRCNIVDMTSDRFPYHADGAEYMETGAHYTTVGGTSNYYYDQCLLTLGMTDVCHGGVAYGDIEAEIKLVGVEGPGGWFYKLPEDPRYMRPLGIDVFARRKSTRSGEPDANLPHELHLGTQSGNISNTNSLSIPASEINAAAIWFDICVVMDGTVDQSNDTVSLDGQLYNLIPSDSYYTAVLELTIKCVDRSDPENHRVITSEKYIVQILSYYKKPTAVDSSESSALLFLEKKSEAERIDINSYYGDPAGVLLATYNFTTNSKASDKTEYESSDSLGCVRIFLSSNKNGTKTSGKFTLTRRAGGNPGNFNTSINYVVKMESSTAYGSSSDGSSDIIFDGTCTFNDCVGGTKTHLVISCDKYRDKNGYFKRWHDIGTITLIIPTTGQDNSFTQANGKINLAAGSYTSDIYVHIVTDFN